MSTMYPTEREEMQQDTTRLLREARAKIWREAAYAAFESAEEFNSPPCRELSEYFTDRAKFEDNA